MLFYKVKLGRIRFLIIRAIFQVMYGFIKLSGAQSNVDNFRLINILPQIKITVLISPTLPIFSYNQWVLRHRFKVFPSPTCKDSLFKYLYSESISEQ